MKRLSIVFVSLLALSVSCYGGGGKITAEERAATAATIPVPLVRQATPYSCGPAALLSVLFYWKAWTGGESSLYQKLHTTEEDGTDSIHMLAFMKSQGFDAKITENTSLSDLKSALDRQEPVIIDFQAWEDGVTNYSGIWEAGHYAVVIGMDTSNVYFMDPSVGAGYAFLSKEDFIERWHDYEIRDGKRVEVYRLALFMSGSSHLTSMPAPISKID